MLLRVFPFLLGAYYRPCCKCVMGASSWALGSRTVAALCHPSHPSASPPALLLCCSYQELPSHPPICSHFYPSVAWWLWLFFHTPDQQCFGIFLHELTPFQPFLLEHAGPSRVREAGTLKWEQVERASRELKIGIRFRDHQKILDASPEGLVIARYSFWHFYFIHSAVHSFFIIVYSNRKYLLQTYHVPHFI